MPSSIPGLRSPYASTRGLVHFPRLLDKARLHARGLLPEAYHGALGRGFDRRICELLRVSYSELVSQSVAHPEHDDLALLAWAESRGRTLTEGDIEICSGYLSKRGWRDDASAKLQDSLSTLGYPMDGSIETFFDLIEYDEGRPPRGTA